jgi:hypothetical protein
MTNVAKYTAHVKRAAPSSLTEANSGDNQGGTAKGEESSDIVPAQPRACADPRERVSVGAHEGGKETKWGKIGKESHSKVRPPRRHISSRSSLRPSTCLKLSHHVSTKGICYNYIIIVNVFNSHSLIRSYMYTSPRYILAPSEILSRSVSLYGP